MSIVDELRKQQQKYKGLPRRRLTGWQRMLCCVALTWPEPIAKMAAALYMHARNGKSH